MGNKYNWIFWMEWLSTAVLIYGCVMNAFNIYPLNIYLCLLGNFGWAVVAWQWRKWSLLVIQGVVSVIYIFGIATVQM